MDPVLEARKGGESAFLKLFDDHHLPLFRFACRLTGSAADAEDIVQECFLELLKPGCSYDGARTSLRSYLYGVVRNQWLKRVRKVGAESERLPWADPAHTPEAAALRGELRDVVAVAVRQLPELQREVLILAHYEQMPLAEIAGVLDLDVGAVKSRLQRARAGLKEMLAHYAPRMERTR
ncbi:MAG: RNA polymerase sigma factor [Terriglobia bacterium]